MSEVYPTNDDIYADIDDEPIEDEDDVGISDEDDETSGVPDEQIEETFVEDTSTDIGYDPDDIEELPPYEEPDDTFLMYVVRYLERRRLEGYEPAYLEELSSRGATFYAVYDDGTEEQIAWQDIHDLDPDETIVDMAELIAGATNQHFWDDTNGAHVAENTKEEWQAAVEANFSDMTSSKNYYNILLNSYGILLRRGLSPLTQIDRTAFSLLDGIPVNPNDPNDLEVNHIISSFGRDQARIGRLNSKHVVLNTNGLTVYSADGTMAPINAIIDGANISRSTINASSIDTSTFTNGSISGSAIDASTFANGTINASSIDASTFTNGSISGSAIDTSAFTNGSISGSAIDTSTFTNGSISGSAIDTSTFTNGSISGSVINTSTFVNGSISGSKIDSSTLTNIPYAEIDQLKALGLTAQEINAAAAFIAALAADSITANDISADHASVANLETDNVSVKNRLTAAEGNIATLNANDATITGRLSAAEGDIDNLVTENTDVKERLTAAEGNINTLTTENVTVNGRLTAAEADIDDLETDNVSVKNRLTAAEGDIETLNTNKATVVDLEAATARISQLETGKADISVLESDYITADVIDSTYTKTDFSNVNVAWIQNGTIKNGSISDAMINSVSANKLTAGTIDASVITVTNLQAEDISVSRINGQTVSGKNLTDALAQHETDISGLDSKIDTQVEALNDRIDGAIETFTGTAVPTLNNTPASSWNTTKLRDQHVGDVYYVVNANSQQNGYCYRFTKSGSTYSWQLIKDSDVTAALARLQTAEGKIGTIEQFDSDISAWKTDTDEELASMKTAHNTLAGRVTTAEGTLATKVDSTTFNTLSQTVDGHTSSINQLTTETNIALSESVEYIVGTQTGATGSWTGTTRETELKTGKTIAYKLPYAGSGNASLNLTLAGGGTTGAIAVYTNTTRVTTHFGAGSVIQLTYDGTYWRAQSIPNTNNIDRLLHNNQVLSLEAIPIWCIVGGTANGYRKIAANVEFDLGYPLLANGSAWVANTAYSNAYEAIPSLSITNTATVQGAVADKMVYLKGTVNGNTFKVAASNFLTCVVPSSEDGFYYIPLGITAHSSATAIFFTTSRQLHAYVGDSFMQVQGISVRTSNKLNETIDTVDEHTRKIGSLETTVATKADGSDLTTVSNRLNTVSDTVDGHTQSITSINSTLATKADGSTVTALDTKVNNISDTVDGHTSSLQHVTEVQTQLRADIDGIEVGGRNLYIHSTTVSGYLNASSGAIIAQSVAKERTSDYIPVIVGETYQFQMWNDTDADHSSWWCIQEFDSSKTFVRQLIRAYPADTYKSYERTIPEGVAYIRISARWQEDGYYYELIKMEKGTNPTDWTPAPEDVDAAIAAVPRIGKINAPQKSGTTEQWKTWGTFGYVGTWTTGSTYDNSHLRVGDTAYVTGTASDGAKGSCTIVGVVTAVNGTNGTTSIGLRSTQLIFGGDAVANVNASLTATQTDYAEYKQATEEFKSTVGSTYATKAELNDLSIGGRNLLKNSLSIAMTGSDRNNKTDNLQPKYTWTRSVDGEVHSYAFADSGASGSYNNAYCGAYYSPGFTEMRGREYAWGLDIKIDGIDNFGPTVYMQFDIDMRPSSANQLAPHCVKLFPATDISDGVWTHIGGTGVVGENDTSSLFEFAIQNMGGITGPFTLSYRRPIVVYGNQIPADWTPAPEDTDASITAIESRVTNAETSISQNRDEIALRAKSSDVYTKQQSDGLISTEVTNRNTAIAAATEAIELSVSETYSTKTELDGVADRIVGRNLLRGTEDATADAWHLYYATVPEEGIIRLTPTTNTASYGCYTVNYLDYSEYNECTYTLSFDVRRLTGSYTDKRLRIIFGFNTAACIGQGFSSTKGDASDRFGNIYIAATEIGTDWTRLHVTFDVPDDLTQGSTNALVAGSQLTVELYLEASGNPVDIRKLKLEKGSVATDWSAAPEDYTDEQVTAAKAAIKVTTDGISSEVSKISSAKYVNSSTASWTLTAIKSYAAEGSLGNWNVTSTSNIRVGDTVYIKGTDSTRSCPVYIKVTVDAINSTTQLHGISHGYEDVLPVDTIKSTINQSSDSVKIQAKHVEIDGAAIFANSDFREAADAAYDVKGAAASAVSGISIGGRNLLLGTSSEVSMSQSYAQIYEFASVVHDMESGTLVVISFDAKSTQAQWIDLYPRSAKSGGTPYANTTEGLFPSLHIVEPDIWYHCEYNGTIGPNAANYAWLSVRSNTTEHGSAAVCGTVSIRNVKLEKGNKATDWTSAPEDSNEAVVVTQRIYHRKSVTGAPAAPTAWVTTETNVYNAWTTKVPPLAASNASGETKYLYLYTCEQRKRLDGTVECTKVLLDENMTVVDGGTVITNSITADKLDAETINASGMLTVGSMTAATQKAIDNSNVVVGGRNLLLKTTDEKSQLYSSTTVMFWQFAFDGSLPQGEYTLSFDMKSSNGTDKFYASVSAGSSTKQRVAENVIPGTSYSRYSVTFNYTQTATSTGVLITSCATHGGGSNNGNDGTVYIKNIKLEIGNKATDYTEAPEDIAADISAAQTTADTANNKLVAFRGVCETAAATAAKVVSCEGFELVQGYSITVYNTVANTSAGALTLNVNGKGAKAIWVSGAATSASNKLLWAAGSTITYVYDGVEFRVADNPPALYGTACTVAEGSAAKTTTSNDCVIFKGAQITVPMSYSNTSTSAALNVSGLGAGTIYYGTSSTVPTKANGYAWPAGAAVIFTFDGSYWRTGNQTFVDGGNILTGTIAADRIKANVISAVNGGTGTINADKINATDLHVQAANIDGTLTASQINANGLTIGYSQIDDPPTIPSKVSDLTNDSGYQTATQVNTTITGKGYQTATQVNTAIENKGYSSAIADAAKSIIVQVATTAIDYSAGTATLQATLYVDGTAKTSGVTYKWFSDGTAITSNGTARTLSVTAAMGLNHVYSCEVTY